MRCFRLLIVFCVACTLAGPARAEVSADDVRSAIDRAVAYLKREQRNSGTWPEAAGKYVGGSTALCTLALLNAGVSVDDNSIQRALSYLRGFRPETTYVLALQTMVFCAAEPKKDLLLIRRNVRWLEENQTGSGEHKGGWSYPGTGGDPSNSQFALLALFEAERVGVKVNDRTWRQAVSYWKELQNPDGSWPYSNDGPGSGSMTTAGISSMIIASGEINSGDVELVGDTVRCRNEQQANQPVDDGLRWLERHFSVHSNPNHSQWLLYYLYGVERVGRMSARRFIGQHDWYREGTDALIRSQDPLSGYWKGVNQYEGDPHLGTSFALLFLAKGRRPVLVAKLKHPPGEDWNRLRGDVANLTSYVEKKWERDLTWQVIDPSVASVDDLLQSPVLFISGRDAPLFTAEQKLRLRDYVDRGGFIFGEACCEGKNFDAGFRKLMSEVFPEEEYKLRLLSPEHPIWRAEEPVNPEYLRPLWGIDIGCRTSVVFCPGELSCFWELDRPSRRQQLPERVQAEVDAALAIGANVMAYATNRELKYKFEHFNTPGGELAGDTLDRGRLYVARLQHPGGCNVAPGALTTLLRLASDKLKLRVNPEVRELSIRDPKLFSFPIVFMHGRYNFRFTPEERTQLKTYLERGGLLFADAICSSKDFNEAFAREMAALFPDARLARIPPNHALFTNHYGGDDLSSVGRRTPQRAASGPLKTEVRQGEPYLEGIQLGDRYAVIFSPFDVSCALENHESLECEGYTRADAGRIGLNVLLYGLHE